MDVSTAIIFYLKKKQKQFADTSLPFHATGANRNRNQVGRQSVIINKTLQTKQHRNEYRRLWILLDADSHFQKQKQFISLADTVDSIFFSVQRLCAED